MEFFKKNQGKRTFLAQLFLQVFIWNSFLYFFLHNKLSVVTDLLNAYSPLAISLLSGKGYTLEGFFYTHHPPLFPLMLAACYKLSGVWGINNPLYPPAVLILQSFTCVVLYRLANKIMAERAALISTWLLATYPFFIILTATRYAWTAMPVALFCFVNALEQYFSGFEKKKGALFFISGFFLGLAGLAWAGMIYAPFVFLIYFLKKSFKESRLWAFLILFAIGFLLPTASWSLYATYKTGSALFVSSASNISMRDGLIRHNYSKLRKYATVQRAQEQQATGQLSTRYDYFLFYKSEIKKFPFDFIKWASYKAARAWYGTDAEKHEGLNLLLQMPYLLLGFLGCFYFASEDKVETGLIISLIFYFWIVTFFVLTTIRYMMPAFMLWMIFAGYGAHKLLSKMGRVI